MRHRALLLAVLAADCSHLGDVTPPQAPVVSAPADGATLGGSAVVDGKVAFSGKGEANATIELDVDGTVVATTTGQRLLGFWSVAAAVPDGRHTAMARATDGAGHVSEWSRPVSFTLDATAPAAPVVLAPQSGAVIDAAELAGGLLSSSGTAEPNATVEVQVDGASARTAAADASGAWSLALPVGAGTHTIQARARDAVGNTSAPSALATVTVPRAATSVPSTSTVPLTTFAQSVPADRGGLGEVFPGRANTWVIGRDYSLARGFGGQFQSALALSLGTPTSPTSHATLRADVEAGGLDAFPADQEISEATFLTPVFTTADGLAAAAASKDPVMGQAVLSGVFSGFLAGTSDSRLSRPLTLTPKAGYTITWSDAITLDAGALAGASAAPYAPSYQVVLRDPTAGTVIQVLYATQASASGRHSVTLASAPASAVLSFELRSSAAGLAAIDDVAVAAVDPKIDAVPLANGDFEAGTLASWTASSPAQSQNVRSARRVIGTGPSALAVTRTLLAPPRASWARLVDVFENVGASPVSTRAIYVTTLSVAAPHVVVRQPSASLVAWDPGRTVRDVGIVAGNGTIFVEDGSPDAYVVHELSVPPGGRVALAHFVVQLGGANGGEAATDYPAPIDGQVSTIAASFPGPGEHTLDLEAGVLGRIANF